MRPAIDGPFVRPALNAALVAVLVFMAAPIVIVVISSFNPNAYGAWPPTGLTLSWYRKVLENEAFLRGFRNSMVVALVVAVLTVLVGAPVAYVLSRFALRGAGVLRSLVFAPLVVPRVALGFGLFALYLVSRSGLYGTVPGMILAHAVLTFPFVVSILSASLGEVPPVIEEAARDLGAGPVRAFVLAVLPQMRPALISALIFAFITSFDELEATIFVTRGTVNTLPVEMFFYLEQYQDPTVAAVSTVLIGLALVLVLLGLLLVRGKGLRQSLTRGGVGP